MRATRAEIDLDALEFNFKQIRKRVGAGVKIMGIVKSNAYGHGLIGIAHALVNLGADYLGAGFLEEGIELRKAGITKPILVFGGAFGEEIRDFLDYDLDVSISSIGIAEFIDRAAAEHPKKANVHIKIDTGMGRLGISTQNAIASIETILRLKHLNVKGLYTHFATSDERDKAYASEQIERFDTVCIELKKRGIEIPLIHAANSGAVIDLPSANYSMVRPGMMMFGVYPSQETTESVPLEPVLSFKSRVIYLKHVPAGTYISYGRKYVTPAPTVIATVPVGYGDGYSRSLTNRAHVLIGGKRRPVVGAVCMDLLMVDVGPESAVKVGDEVVLIGSQGTETVSAWEIASLMNTIPYEVFTGISVRVPRVMVHGRQSQSESIAAAENTGSRSVR
ncbi:MAG TPA: alanine racemase [Bacteroidota bacterium]|nr:alanine racemase [Bacteroidota bacterium]